MDAVPRPIAVLAVSRRGAELAARIASQLDADVCLPDRLRPSVSIDHRVIAFADAGGVRDALATAFRRYRGIVLVLPVGAAVRLLAPLLEDKHTDPAVVALDEAGAHAVALLSGHVGGGNALTREVARAVGARPVITTAAEALGILALDLLGRDQGWIIDDGSDVTRASAALIAGELVGAYQDAGEESWWQQAPPNLTRYPSVSALAAAPVAARLVISDRLLSEPLAPPVVVYRPGTLVAGVGCVRGATAEEIGDLLARTLAHHQLALASVRVLATVDRKADEPGITALAAAHGWTVRTFPPRMLAAAGAPSGASPAVQRAIGAPGVCEPAALLAAGASSLVVPKTRSRRVTVAVARHTTPALVAPAPQRDAGPHAHRSPSAADTRGAGQLSIVGLGPGGQEGLTERARAVLARAEVVVGYQGYLDLLRPWLVGPDFHGSPIGAEVHRAQHAIALARAGRRVALVSSGDAGVYGTAGIVFELLHTEGAEDEAAEVEVVPGVSAANAAAALLGAPLMNDYAAISLSDLLTPWEVIERRLQAAASADLVVALYNPASTRRRWQLARAQEILLRHRPADTPVGLVRNAARPGQSVHVIRLGELCQQEVDMLTIVIVGNRATVRVGNRIVTRRGYRGEASATERGEG
ncbi:MAG TPA: precorrin-3B C(17)-methyltransferase [bacterium]|nr:precorrin-3B C(17)-methyltransferase [bacterium]